ncbi:MAG TPA: hypothetical protein VLX28_07360 [Thermoanaerobaculia bacterium]|nr:hypothetical protein [Thermoanaerobaculia bacterium]
MRSFLVIAMLISFCSPFKPAVADSFCDPALTENTKGTTTYKMRGDRCEGIFAQQVSSPHIEIRSLVGTLQSFDPKKDSEVVLSWTAPPGNNRDVQLRAFSFKPLVYYRMDTRVPFARSTYRWPTDVLGSAGLGQADLGLLAWTELLGTEGTKRVVYLPLRTGTGSSRGDSGYTVKFLPSTRLIEVRVKVSRLDGQGKASDVLRDEKLIDEYYAPSEPADFSTSKLGPAGFYRITITARPKTGLPIVQDIDLYHPGP